MNNALIKFNQLPDKWLILFTSILLFLSPIIYFQALQNPSHVPRIVLLSLVSILTAFMLVTTLWKHKTEFYFNKIHILVLLLLTWATLSIFWTIDYGNFAYEIIPLWGLVLLFFVTSHLSSISSIKILIFVSLLGASYAAIIALLQNYNINPFGYRQDFANASVMNSTFGFKNHLALYLDLVIPVALALTLIIKNQKIRWLCAILTGLILGVLVELHTRGSWLTLIAWLFIALFFIYKDRNSSASILVLLNTRKKELLLILVISVLTFLPAGEIDKTWSRSAPDDQALDNSSLNRLLFYHNSIHLIKDNAITGVGYGAFWKGFRTYMNHPHIIKPSTERLYVYRAHNDPLQYFVELGIPGGTLVLLIFSYIAYMGIKLFHSYNNHNHKILILGLLLSLFACGIHSLLDFPLHKPSSAIQFWVALGLITGLYIKHFSHPQKIRKLYLSVVTIIIVLYSVVSYAFHTKHIKSNYFHRQAVIAMLEKDCASATKYIDQAILEGDFFLPTHAQRVNFHIDCKSDNNSIFEVLNQELEWDNTNTMALIYRGYLFLNAGYLDEALNDFKRAVYILPHRPTAKIGVARTLIALNKDEQAIQLLNKIITEHPEIDTANQLLNDLRK